MKPYCLFASLYLLLWGHAGIAQNTMTDIPYPPDTRYITLPSGQRIAYTDTGSGAQTLLLVHGLGSNLKCWQKNVAALSAHFRCVALDLPGYGRSGKGDYAYDMAFFAQTLREFAAALDLKNLSLVGHSMGAQIALHAALQDSTLAQRLVLLAPAGFETFTEQERAWFSLVYTPAVLQATPPEQIRKNFDINFFRFPADAEFMIQDRLALRESADYPAYCAMIPKCVAGMLQQPVFDRLPELKIPVLVLYGENDGLIPNRFLHKGLTTRQVAESGQQRLPNSRLLLLPECGHFVQWEAAGAVNQAILDFFTT